MVKWVTACTAVICSLLLVYFNSVWNLTPLPKAVGRVMHELNVSSERAAVAAALAAQDPASRITLPVLGASLDDIVDTYGAPRGADRTHEGIDIFATRGTYVVSATPGVVARIGTNRLGGNIVFVLGPGGERYYYAHLDSVDPVLKVGQPVSTTTVLGRVGTTGNAAGTPPHLHFGIYRTGGTTNPYERLR